ncbi:MAG TPA: cytidine deaminase [Thermoleophilaceae bacterium]|nr:cytidine deaminase [Thermoleophilaceae bacterium]
MRNIEFKARDPQPARTLELALALGADDRGEIAQTDTYFSRARGRLKLREQQPGDAELIQYRRADAPGARESEYRRVATADAPALRDALDAALGTLVVVEKRRRLLLRENVRIHLDEVEGLGSFLELEAVTGPDADLAAERDKLERLRAELEIRDNALVPLGYSDLLLDTPDLLLSAADAAMRNAHAPYSEFKVGAALRTPSGAVYAGANVENASYPQGQCAETSAIGALVAAGESEIAAVAVVAEKLDICPPCGGCRQRLSELAGPDTPVHLGRPGGEYKTFTIADLLPLSFELRP